ncbi:hypothetical protein JTB14_006153 [Gonioctena quinquepunctata]|nr:hypothetical protein JTB14_006153 [Gonioctena quinquepunctata]
MRNQTEKSFIDHIMELLTDVDKVNYLVGRLKGFALGVCTGVSPTGGNYNIIWKSLNDKYQDARSLATSYLDQILGFKHIQGESAKNLESFLEKFDCAVQALKNLKLQDLADFILVHQALAKLNSETVKSFEMSVRGEGIPTYEDVIKCVKDFGGVQLADDKFDEPTEIDGIIGAELFATVMENDSYASSTGSSVAVQTVVGYVIMGKVPIFSSVSDLSVFFNLREESSLNELMKKFWEIVQVPKNTLPNKEELECEKMYTSTFNRDSVGRLTVALLFKNSPNTLGDSKECAMTRLFSLERKLTEFSELRSGYNDIMRESIEQGHMYWRLLCRFSPDEPVHVYEFNRLAFGVKTSPYLALRTVKQLIKEERYKYPFAAEVASTDIYMDDLVCGVPSEEEAHRLYSELVAMFAEGKFDLTKWSSSYLHLLEKIPSDRRLSQPKWSKLKDEWSAFEKIQFSRYMETVGTSPVMLVAFADTSMDGYGAVVYVRTVEENGEITVNLLCAKSKVSPFKVVTIPRLELVAALLSS